MSAHELGPGWRRLGPDDGPIGDGETYLVLHERDGDTHFVPEVPPPPLPTQPYTVIRVTWRHPGYLTGSHIYTLSSDHYWTPQNRHADPLRDRELASKIRDFEILAVPVDEQSSTPKAIAKAVLERVRELRPDRIGTMRTVEQVAHEFGVKS